MQHDELDLHARYKRVLNALPVLTRTVFVLHACDELSLPQVAHRTGLSSRDVEEHLASALISLDSQIGTIDGDGAVTNSRDRR